MPTDHGFSEAVTIAGAIVAYLCARPAAADTTRGVCDWWLAHVQPPPAEVVVLAVLEELERGGLIRRNINADNTVIWSVGVWHAAAHRRSSGDA